MSGSRGAGLAGFTLLEVVIATAVIAVSAAACSGIVLLAGRQTAELAALTDERDAAVDLATQLQRLPFTGRQAAGGAQSVLSRLFPHARPDLNRPDAFYCSQSVDGWPAGSFVTRVLVDGRDLLVGTSFVGRRGGSWGPVPPSGVDGFVATNDTPPAACVAVDVYPTTRRRRLPLLSFCIDLEGAAVFEEAQ